MIKNSYLSELFYNLIQNLLPEQVALGFGFSENEDERFYVSSQNQSVRDDVQTALYFSVVNNFWRSQMQEEKFYNGDNKEVMVEMRQAILTLDVYSKIIPLGTASDVLRYISAKIQGDAFSEWCLLYPEIGITLERVEMSPDLSALLQGETWSERRQLKLYFNFRDAIVMDEIPMTKMPDSIGDVKNIIVRDYTYKK